MPAVPRSGRSMDPRWMARCPETRSSSKAVPAVKSATRAQWARCSSCPAPGHGMPPTATATAWPIPQNLYDSTLAAARYLCSGGLNLRDPSQVMAAILRYNNSIPYARNVLGWAAAYATGVVPVDLPPVTGPAPPLGDLHLENPEGLGPGLPLNVYGLPSTDPMAQTPLIDLGQGRGG